MKVPTKKNINWDLKRKIFKLKKRVTRWWERYVRRQKIRGYIIDNESDVVKAISLKGEYTITIDSFVYHNGDHVYAYKLIAMRYGLEMSISNTRTACLYLITLKKRQ